MSLLTKQFRQWQCGSFFCGCEKENGGCDFLEDLFKKGNPGEIPGKLGKLSEGKKKEG